MVNDWQPMPEPEPASDSELLEAIRDGDLSATTVFVSRHMAWAIEHARKLGAGQEARDLAHDALLGLIRRPPAELREESVRALLGTDLRHRVSKARRKQARLANEGPGSSLADEFALSSLARLRRRVEDMVSGLARLGERDQRLLRLRFFEERRYGEIAERLGVSESAARGAVFRALRLLRREVDRGSREPSSA